MIRDRIDEITHKVRICNMQVRDGGREVTDEIDHLSRRCPLPTSSSKANIILRGFVPFDIASRTEHQMASLLLNADWRDRILDTKIERKASFTASYSA